MPLALLSALRAGVLTSEHPTSDLPGAFYPSRPLWADVAILRCRFTAIVR